jgi:hypothetical protein
MAKGVNRTQTMISVIVRIKDMMPVSGPDSIDLPGTPFMTGFFALLSSDGAGSISLRIGKQVRIVKGDMRRPSMMIPSLFANRNSTPINLISAVDTDTCG